MLRPGAHVTTLGPDEPGKAELAAEVLRSALFVCDDRALAVEMGALGGVGLGPSAVGAELGEVLGGTHPGRIAPEQITVFGGVGLVFQDAVAAWAVYREARRAGAGREVDFLA
jgi:ornithine cyclodeaminase